MEKSGPSPATTAKGLRRGFTTGTAAAAAARAAALLLLEGEKPPEVEVVLPQGGLLAVEINRAWKAEGEREGAAEAEVIKDAGDDPDVTDGLAVRVRVRKRRGEGIAICGGEGVGRVTLPGLAVPVGEAAINPVPRKMIRRAVREFTQEDGLRIEIAVPRGREVAGRTFNPRLGIAGGISILGTTGLVEPMSSTACRDSLLLAVRQAGALGERELILVFGNYGRDMALRLGFPERRVIRMSNFVGPLLRGCAEQGIRKVLLLGHPGKLVKVAAGIFDTHSSTADARRETIAAHAAALGGSAELVHAIMACSTTVEMLDQVEAAGLEAIYHRLGECAVRRAEEHIRDLTEEMRVEAVFFLPEKGVLGGCPRSAAEALARRG